MVRSSVIHLRAVSQEIPQQVIITISLKISYLTFYQILPGTNGLLKGNTDEYLTTTKHDQTRTVCIILETRWMTPGNFMSAAQVLAETITYYLWKYFNNKLLYSIESLKTTSVENVSTGVLKKNKEHYLRSKDKADKWYDVSRHV